MVEASTMSSGAWKALEASAAACLLPTPGVAGVHEEAGGAAREGGR